MIEHARLFANRREHLADMDMGILIMGIMAPNQCQRCWAFGHIFREYKDSNAIDRSYALNIYAIVRWNFNLNTGRDPFEGMPEELLHNFLYRATEEEKSKGAVTSHASRSLVYRSSGTTRKAAGCSGGCCMSASA